MMPDMGTSQDTTPETRLRTRLLLVWEHISHTGLAEAAYRLVTHALLIIVVLLIAWGLRAFYRYQQVSNRPLVFAASEPTATPAKAPPSVRSIELPANHMIGVSRQVWLHTDLPSRSRSEVIHYVVQPGDTLFGLAERFMVKPETILWANQAVFGDDPHNLRAGQELTILPVDGIYHRWSAGEGLAGVAKFFEADPQDIISYPGNGLDPETIGDWSDPTIEPGTWLVVPDGRREFVSWSAPEITRDNPSVARVLGAGACEAGTEGAVGSAVFIWPANSRFLSGFEFNPGINHPGIDIDGLEGDPVYAADSGVIVYAGWNDWGYGYMVVINHGNDWQTLYAHLGAIYVSCGQSVWQGDVIGAIGGTGNAAFPHLHFEMMFEGQQVSPHNYIQ